MPAALNATATTCCTKRTFDDKYKDESQSKNSLEISIADV